MADNITSINIDEEETEVIDNQQTVTNTQTEAEAEPTHEFMDMKEISEIDSSSINKLDMFDKAFWQNLSGYAVDSPWEKAEIYKNAFDEYPEWGGVRADKYNNPILLWNDEPYYINKPGISAMDVGEFTSELVKYIPASKWVQGGKSLISRLKRGFLGYGGTETISEIIEKQLAPEVNRQTQKTMTGLATDVAIPTAIGMAADVVVPPALKYGGKAIKGATRAGIKGVEKLSAPKYQPAVQAAADAFKPKTQVTSKYPLTVGQQTGDLQQLKSEDIFRRAGPSIIRDFDETQLNLIIKDAEELRNVMGSGDPLISQADDVGMAVGERVQTIVGDAAENLKSQAKSGYNFVKELDDTILNVPYSKNLGKDLVNTIKSEVDADTLKMLPNLSNVLKRMEKLAKTGKFVTKKGSQNVNDLWSLQKQLNVLADNAGPGNERNLIKKLKRQLDGEVYKGIDSGFISGNADILQNLKNSTGMYAQYMGLTGESWAKTAPEKKANLILKKLTNSQIAPKEVVESLFGHAKFNTKSEMKIVLEKLNKLIPEEQMVEVKALMKDAILTKAFTNRTGKMTRKSIVDNFNNIFVKNKFIVDELFSPDEILKIKSFRDEVMPTLAAEINTNPSGTAFTLVAALENMGLISWTRAVWPLREMREGLQEIGERARMLEATKQFLLRFDNPLLGSVPAANIMRESVEGEEQLDTNPLDEEDTIEFNIQDDMSLSTPSLDKIVTGLSTSTIDKLIRQL
jgi:hypothetical protein